MAENEKLTVFLDEGELENIPPAVKLKICHHICTLDERVTELRSSNEELSAILESQAFKFEKEVFAAKQQALENTESCTKLKSQVVELESSLSSVQKEWRDLQKTHDSAMLEFQTIKRDNQLLIQEKRNLTEQLDKRRSEIEKLNGDQKSLLDQVTAANEAKFEAIASAEEATLKESNLQHLVNRLEQEKTLLSQQITDLNTELTHKNSEIHTMKREKNTSLLELNTELENKTEEIQILQVQLESCKKTMEEKDTKIESLAKEIAELNETNTKEVQTYIEEISSQKKLIELINSTNDENSRQIEELERVLHETVQKFNEQNELSEQTLIDFQLASKMQCDTLNDNIALLKKELKEAEKAAKDFNHDAIEKVFPIAAATSKMLHSGMTLTQLYVEYNRVQEELQLQKTENAKLTKDLKQIIAEIEEKTPLMQQRIQAYDNLCETNACLKSQLARAQTDYEAVLEEKNDSRRAFNSANRENERLKLRVTDLCRQVQVLLNEIEESRASPRKYGSNINFVEDFQKSERSSSSAANVISKHLVTFKNIEELQTKNGKLLAALRELSQQNEELESKVSADVSAKFQKDIEALSSQLEDLQKKRETQSTMLETIVRQRDMYRALLSSNGISDSILEPSDGSDSILEKSVSFVTDQKTRDIQEVLKQTRTDFNSYKSEKSKSEKLLNDRIEHLQSVVASLRTEKSKLTSKCEYSSERLNVLETNLHTYKNEQSLNKEKSKQQSIMMVQHQKTINSLREDLMVAQEKIARYEVTIENLKAERDLLKTVESRLLQEKESAIREQQHQSRMMAKLQAVQNNLERIESDTKRNLQYQVEKYEKECSILKTKVENSNDEYRAAFNIWEKQKQDLQSKIDSEIERNRKTHDDLVDAYSQVHALNQEILSLKNQLVVVADKPATQSPAKQSVATPPKKVPDQNEIKLLKEQLSEAQLKAKSAEDKLLLISKTSDQYLALCKDLETRVKEQDEINKHLKDSMDNVLQSNTETRKNLEKSLENMEKSNRDLIEENINVTQERNKQINDLQIQLNKVSKEISDYKNNAETSKRNEHQARQDCQTQLKLMQEVQEKYERELLLHADDVRSLSDLKEEHQKCSMKMEQLEEAAKAAQRILEESKESWMRQEEIYTTESTALRAKIHSLEDCNSSLHNQLELLGTQMVALHSRKWEDTPYTDIQQDLKDTKHLLGVIRFVKKEKEIATTQFDAAKSENVRLNIKVEQLSSELNSVRSELKEVTSNIQAKAASEAQHSELLKKIEMMNLLSESNNLLRMEKESLSDNKTRLEQEVRQLQEKLQPLLASESELRDQIDMLTTENRTLKGEVSTWQSRANQLLEQSHRIGPQEYKNVMREVDELKSQKARLVEELQKKQSEVQQTLNSVAAARRELETTKAEIETKTHEIEKIQEENSEHQKTILTLKKIARKYRTQYEELKITHDVLVAKQISTNQDGGAVQDLKKKIEDSEKALKELREETAKQKEETDQANVLIQSIRAEANEKEQKAKNLLAQFRRRYSLLNNQKDELAQEKTKLVKDIEDSKKEIATINESNAQIKSQLQSKIAQLEKDCKMSNDTRISDREFFQKQYDELLQKVSQQKQGMKSQIVGIGERTSGGAEPLTANIKPITAPQASGASQGLRHSAHVAATLNRPTPTASIRPMAMSAATPAGAAQSRTATVLPTTAASQQSDDLLVPHATVQPVPVTITVAPTSAVSVLPVISEVAPTIVQEDSHPETTIPMVHAPSAAVSSPPTALVMPRMEEPESSTEALNIDSPAPTTSVIVSPPTTQTQIVPPTVKRPREDSPSTSDTPDASIKRIRMVSEGSQTSQPMTSVVTSTNIAQILPQSSQKVYVESEPSTSQVETVIAEPIQAESATVESSPSDLSIEPVLTESVELAPTSLEPALSTSQTVEVIGVGSEAENVEWESREEPKIEEFEAEEMEDEVAVDEDVEQMQGIDARTPDDEDMTEDQQDETEEMDQPTPTASDIDIADATSDLPADIQMEGDSGSGSAPTEMAPPTFLAVDVGAQSASNTLRVERQAIVGRQHLIPFVIPPGQGGSFEEVDDGSFSIVPSTPTLYVPRRSDGFAEAVSSPHVQSRFLFSSSESSPTQQGLLASQGALGVEDTSMDLSQLDEGNRTVPSTPVQVSPPAEATVPDVGPGALETEVSSPSHGNIIPPTITVDFVEDSQEAVVSQDTERSEASVPDISISDTAASQIEVAVQDPPETDVQPEEEPSLVESTQAPVFESENVKQDPVTEESEESAKDSATTTRKRIVWLGSSQASTSAAPKLQISPPKPQLSFRGRGRVRRSKFVSFGRGTGLPRGGPFQQRGGSSRGGSPNVQDPGFLPPSGRGIQRRQF